MHTVETIATDSEEKLDNSQLSVHKMTSISIPIRVLNVEEVAIDIEE